MAPKKHVCHRCGRSFARREHVERHERSHTKEQPFACTVCRQAFTRKDLLTRHRRLSHQHVPPVAQHAAGHEHHGGQPSLAVPYSPPFGESSATNDGLLLPPNVAAPSAVISEGSLSAQDGTMDFFDSTTWGDFSVFTDNLAFPFYPYSPSDHRMPLLPGELLGSIAPEVIENNVSRGGDDLVPAVVDADGLSRFGSRLPSLDRDDHASTRTYDAHKKAAAHPHMTSFCLELIKLQLESFSNVVPKDFTLPSRHAFNRFIHGYFSGFHGHYPIFHLPTLSLEKLPVELILSIAAIGAQYCLERSPGFKLFYSAKYIAMERLRRQATDGPASNEEARTDYESRLETHLQAVHTFLLLTAVSMWSEKEPPFHEALSIRSILERLLQRDTLAHIRQPLENNWNSWITYESVKRAAVIVFLSLQPADNNI